MLAAIGQGNQAFKQLKAFMKRTPTDQGANLWPWSLRKSTRVRLPVF